MPGPDMSLDRFVDSLQDLPTGDEGPRQVLRGLTRIASEQASAVIAVATGYAANEMDAAGHVGWVVAVVGQPAVIAVRDDLDDPERIWIAARLLVQLRNTPLTLDPLDYAWMGSPDIPSECWPPGQEHEAVVDDEAVALLLSMKVPEPAARLFHRPPCK